MSTSPTSRHRPARDPRTLVASVRKLGFWFGLLALAAAAFVGVRFVSSTASASSDTGARTVDPEGLTETQAAQFRAWISEYPADEVKLITSNGASEGAITTDVALVTTLEFRAACRTMANAFDGDAKAIASMPDQIDRLADRALAGDAASGLFAKMAEMVRSGDRDGAARFLNTNCDQVVGLR